MQTIEENNFNILIASEKIDFRDALATRLRIQDFHVEFATSGFHLLHLIEKPKGCSLVILFENMADMPADEIILMIRSTKNKTELPILYVSQKNCKEEIFNKVTSGVNDYIVRTSHFQPIIARVRKYFELLKNS